MRWIIHRTLLVAMTLLLLCMAPLCLVASDGHAVAVAALLELILVLTGIVAVWWVAFVLNCPVRRR